MKKEWPQYPIQIHVVLWDRMSQGNVDQIEASKSQAYQKDVCSFWHDWVLAQNVNTAQ